MSHSTGSATISAIQRLSDDELSSIAQCLKGTEAVNFGRVCKAWVALAELAIWKNIEIKQVSRDGEVPGVIDRGTENGHGDEEPDSLSEQLWYSEQIGAIGERYKGLLAGLQKRPQRAGMVKNVAIHHEAGQPGADFLAAVRQSVQSLSIVRILDQDGCDFDDAIRASYHIEGSRPSMIGLLDASVTFDACVHLHLHLDQRLATSDPTAILRLTRHLVSLSLGINGDPTFRLSGTCDMLDSVQELKLACTMLRDPYVLPKAATEILSRCPNVSRIEIWHPDEDFIEHVGEWYFETEHGYEDDDFADAISGLKHLKSLMWHESANSVFPPTPAEESRFQALEHLTLRLAPHSWRSLASETNYEESVPGLTKLRSLSFVALWPERDQRSKIIDTSSSSGLLSQAAVNSCERAPQLEFIQVTLDPHPLFPVSTSPVEVLVVNDFRQEDTDGPRLFLTRRFVFDSLDSLNGKESYAVNVAEDLAPDADVASVFQGKAVPFPVIRRMAEIDGVHSFKGRAVKVSARAWTELEQYMASPVVADET